MKHILLIVTFLMTTVSFGQLSLRSEMVKENLPEAYQSIKEFAVHKWEDDHNMVVHEINQQTEAILKFGKLSEENKEDLAAQKIIRAAVEKWSEGDISSLTGNNTIDWKMVVYEIEKQLEAYNSY